MSNSKKESQAYEIESLSCKVERIDQSSPELWPEQMPGVTSFSALLKASQTKSTILDIDGKQDELTEADLEKIDELSSLSVPQIMERFLELKNQAYQLGIEEAKEMTRGKYLNILGK
ncbi:protein lin-52 homolog [Hydra vulgaris]|uniref:Protein lin-52 homolog n=1 Tax=Hydra vulgaris TaxID=6087 RepID=T2MBY0_HYDVU|nr:protein lin-52 homolog [Hydra vulgaris]